MNIWRGGKLKDITFRENTHTMIAIIREKHATTPLVVISPLFSSVRELERDEGGLTLVEMRSILKEVVTSRIAAGDGHIDYVDGLELLGPDDAQDLSDLTHLSAAGHSKVGRRFHETMLKRRWPVGI